MCWKIFCISAWWFPFLWMISFLWQVKQFPAEVKTDDCRGKEKWFSHGTTARGLFFTSTLLSSLSSHLPSLADSVESAAMQAGFTRSSLNAKQLRITCELLNWNQIFEFKRNELMISEKGTIMKIDLEPYNITHVMRTGSILMQSVEHVFQTEPRLLFRINAGSWIESAPTRLFIKTDFPADIEYYITAVFIFQAKKKEKTEKKIHLYKIYIFSESTLKPRSGFEFAGRYKKQTTVPERTIVRWNSYTGRKHLVDPVPARLMHHAAPMRSSGRFTE